MKISKLFSSIISSLVILTLISCGDSEPENAIVADGDNEGKAAQLFNSNCKLCHGTDGRLGLNGAKDLTLSQLSVDERKSIITNGKNLMTPFGKVLSQNEIEMLAEYTIELKSTQDK
ncbi:MAG: cytochrome c [Lewinellaceae bacterium]|nr:cytochrome c [Saprospiraceae bacterium]MCB9345110.1 cytochrome c [Lewinellaceae bacterium]